MGCECDFAEAQLRLAVIAHIAEYPLAVDHRYPWGAGETHERRCFTASGRQMREVISWHRVLAMPMPIIRARIGHFDEWHGSSVIQSATGTQRSRQPGGRQR